MSSTLLHVDRAPILLSIFSSVLDPKLHTFDYVRRRSHGLLSAICVLATKFMPQASFGVLTRELDNHVRKVILPAVMLEGYRSVELVQALIILAAHHPTTSNLVGDRSWVYLGHAIRMGAELDMNSKMASELARNSSHRNAQDDTDPRSRSSEEEIQRILRNRERAWLNLFLFEVSLSAHTGRRPTLGVDPIVLSCDSWHKREFAIPEDEAIIAIVQLRRSTSFLAEFYENSLGTAAPAGKNPAAKAMLVDTFRRACDSDLGSWRSRWLSSSSIDARPGRNAVQPPTRLRNGLLYYHYAALLLNSFVLRNADLEHAALEPSLLAAYTHATSYLQEFCK